jgi:transcriptional regulator with XRE-family HTH domain
MKKVDIRQVFAGNLRARMKQSGMTQTALATRSGVSQAHISDILRGTTKVTLDLVADLAHALRCEAWELLVDSETTRQNVYSMVLGIDKPQPLIAEPEPPRKRPKKGSDPRPEAAGGGE